MATEGQVVEAINHILKYHPQWRGHLNDDDYRRLNEILHTQQTDPAHRADRVNSYVPDTLIGALRNQWPTLFKGPEFTDPPPAGPPPGTGPAGVPGSQPAPGAPGPGAPAPAAPDISGAAADAATRLDSTLAKNRTALNAADDELADAVLRAKATSEAGKAKLQELQQSIIDEVKKLGDTLDTPAGQPGAGGGTTAPAAVPGHPRFTGQATAYVYLEEARQALAAARDTPIHIPLPR
ncbi:hypothetical protein LAUMK40_05900 [Mycobacterium kansasii]|uniref:DUF4226 domain-containing protein n=1 Tax=Mycobacterium kansasii TaxID=1768 RepID=UPI000F01D03E|nr:DUF4226 domain-containing protein [Mycobacterium kansasii]VAZ69737.1 hypothetical protein LAUMK40_05900 [Mycobacterium kansasii]